MQRVVALGQVGRQCDLRRREELAVDFMHLDVGQRLHRDVVLVYGAVFECDRDLRRLGDGQMDGHVTLLAHNVQHGGFDEPHGALVVHMFQRHFDGLLAGGIDIQGLQHGHEHVIGNLMEITRHADITGRHAQRLRETNKGARKTLRAFFVEFCHNS